MKRYALLFMMITLTISGCILINNPQDGNMVFVEGGSFEKSFLRSAEDDSIVTINDFYIGKYEVNHEAFIDFLNDVNADTNGMYEEVKVVVLSLRGYDSRMTIEYDSTFCLTDSGVASSEECTAVWVTWFGAVHYCNWLSEKNGLELVYTIDSATVEADLSKNGYRLPTEEEWEYAAKGGQESLGYEYSGSDTCENVAWYSNNTFDLHYGHVDFGIHQGGLKQANELGLYDMSGNAWEWCGDLFENIDYSIYPGSGPMVGRDRVLRGGGWQADSKYCNLTHRSYYFPYLSWYATGFRLVRSAI